MAKMETHFIDPAKVELEEAIVYYNGQRDGLGKEFAAEVADTLERIRQFPDAWSRSTKGTRVCPTRRFPYGLVYKVVGHELVIFAVMHLHRRPTYWRART
jgi:hypothetical protein